ncbi:MAG TPA: DEAD/DEAH box helicase [Acidimicrobiales bacterium]
MPPTFTSLGVPADLVAILAGRGITEPFAIQAATLPDALAGHDVCGKAPTGSGKTLAFALTLAMRTEKALRRRPRALVLAPTRELAAQIQRELAPLASARGRSVTAVYGGTGYEAQNRALHKGVDILVACPGRLEDLVARGDVRLGDVDLVVVDEADRMADMGFLPAVRRLLDATADDRQTLLYSATLDGEVNTLVKRYQHDPRRHDAVPVEDEAGDVQHLFWHAEPSARVGLIADLVSRHGSTIVFCRTKHGADRLVRQLAHSGVEAVAIHGNRSQAQRDRALAAFTKGAAEALVATDVVARGIHVTGVSCVVHFDLPADVKDYVHRSGRTGRAGADGTVVSFVPPDRELRRSVRAFQRELGLPEVLDTPDGSTAPKMAAPPRAAAPARTGAPTSRPPETRARRRPRRRVSAR